MHLRDMTGRVHFGIITVKDEEFTAVLARFPKREALTDGRALYAFAEIQVPDGRTYGVAVTRCLEQGPIEAANVTRNMIEDLDPSWLLLVGIAGGVPADEFSLGDVVLASRLHDFSVTAAREGQSQQLSVAGGPVHPEVGRFLAFLPAHRERLHEWSSAASIGLERPAVAVPDDPTADVFYGSADWRNKTRGSLLRHFPKGQSPRPPAFWIGAAASSPTLVKDTSLLEQWREAARSVNHVEMELAGVYSAAQQLRRIYPVLAIRSLSDIVGYRRSPDWTEYACHAAASFAAALIQSGLLEPAVPSSESREARPSEPQSAASASPANAATAAAPVDPESVLWPLSGAGVPELEAARRQLRADLPGDAHQTLERARATFDAARNPLGLAAVELVRGDIEYFRGNEDLAQTAYSEARDRYAELRVPNGVLKAWLGLSRTLCVRSDYDGARLACEQARDLLGDQTADTTRADVFLHLALVELESLRLGEARGAIQRALTGTMTGPMLPGQAKPDRKSYIQANAFYILGEIERLRGFYDEAITALRLAFAHWRTIGSRHGMANAEMEQGHVEYDRGRLDEALGHYRRAASEFKDIDEPYGHGLASCGLALVHCERGELAEADAEAVKAWHALSAREKSLLGTVGVLRIQAQIALKRGDLPRAALLVEQASTALGDRKKNEEAAWLDVVRGDLALANGDAAHARDYYRDALMFFKDTGLARGRAFTTLSMARALQLSNDVDLARQSYETARADYASFGNASGEASAREALQRLEAEAETAKTISPRQQGAHGTDPNLASFRDVGRRGAILFVHGLGGDPRFSWQRFPAFLTADPRLQDWDVFSLAYRSSLRSSLDTLSLQLYTYLTQSRLQSYEHVALVTHGEGGVIAQLALLNHEDLRARVTHAFFFASPNAGLTLPVLPFFRLLLKLASALSIVEPVVELTIDLLGRTWFRLLFDLAHGSAFLSSLNERWKKMFGDDAPFQYWVIAADRDSFVSVESLTLFPSSRRLVVMGDHVSIVKPNAPTAQSVEIVVNGLVNRDPPRETSRAAAGTVALATKAESGEFDTLLYCNSADGEVLHDLSERLKQRGIRPWLIKEQVRPGQRWRTTLEKDIDQIKSVAICIGRSGPRRKEDEQALLADAFSKRSRAVIPVYLRTCPPEDDELPAFLQGINPVDFRDPSAAPLDSLDWGITGQRPLVRRAQGQQAVPTPATPPPAAPVPTPAAPARDSSGPPRRRPLAAVLIIVAILVIAAIGWRAYEYFVSSTPHPKPPDSPASDRNRPHYVRGPGHDHVLVFVHGFLGNAEDTWTSPPNTYWPELLAADRDFDDTDIYVAKYDTSVGNRMVIDELAINLDQRQTHDRVFSGHRQVTFLCHSLGGLVIQRLLLMNRDYAKQVKEIFLYATPQSGAQIARIASLFSGDPLLRQMRASSWNDYLRTIETDWRSAHFAIHRNCAYEKLPYNGVLVVDELSGTRLCDGTPVAINKNHVDIVKPVDADDDSYVFLKNRWREAFGHAASARAIP